MKKELKEKLSQMSVNELKKEFQSLIANAVEFDMETQQVMQYILTLLNEKGGSNGSSN